jgi:hypothetical protein
MKKKSKVVNIWGSSDPRYIDLELDCGHIHRFPKRRVMSDYPTAINCQQCRDEAAVKRQEILPAKWVYVVFQAVDPDNLKPDYYGTLTPSLVYESWVVFGTLAVAKEKAPQVWEQLRAGHNWQLEDINYYPNNYKPRSRALIERGCYTPQ